MGANDAAEMLLVAQDECIRLERYNAELQQSLQEAFAKYVKDTDILFLLRKAAERERDAARAVIAAVHLAIDEKSIPAETFGENWVMVDDLTQAMVKAAAAPPSYWDTVTTGPPALAAEPEQDVDEVPC